MQVFIPNSVVGHIYDARQTDPLFFEQKFGKGLQALDADWAKDIAERFSKIDDREQKMKDYFEKTPIRFMNMCDGK